MCDILADLTSIERLLHGEFSIFRPLRVETGRRNIMKYTKISNHDPEPESEDGGFRKMVQIRQTVWVEIGPHTKCIPSIV